MRGRYDRYRSATPLPLRSYEIGVRADFGRHVPTEIVQGISSDMPAVKYMERHKVPSAWDLVIREVPT
jgi:hypothetical protein